MLRSEVLVAALVAVLWQQTARPPAPEATADPLVVPLELVGGRPVVSVKVNGDGPFRFLVDPSSSTGQLDVSLADELHVRPTDARTVKGGGVAAADARFVDVSIGPITAPAVEMRLVDMATIIPEFGSATRPRGILGSAVWRGLLLTVDYPSWRLSAAPGSLPAPDGREVFTLDPSAPEGAPVVDVEGKSIRCHIDVLSTAGLLLPDSFAGTLPLTKPPVDSGLTRTRHGAVAVREAQLAADATFASAVFAHPVVQFSPGVTTPTVGAAWLDDFSLIFDLTNGRVRLVHRPRG